MSQSDIRKWFMKSHEKGSDNAASKPAKSSQTPSTAANSSNPKKAVRGSEDTSGRRKTSKYFSEEKDKDEKETVQVPAKRKSRTEIDDSVKPLPAKKVHKVEEGDEDDDFVLPNAKKHNCYHPKKKNEERVTGRKAQENDESDDEDIKDAVESPKSGGRGRCGRGGSAAPAAGRGRGRGGGGGHGGFMNFGERKDPPNKGQKVPVINILVNALIVMGAVSD